MSKDALLARLDVHGSVSDYYERVEWSPDGTCLLAGSANHKATVFIVPPDLLTSTKPLQLEPYSQVSAPERVYSSCWYPRSNLNEPESMCYLIASKDQPIHLYDALTGQLRASYPYIDHQERYVSPHSMVFSSDGSRIICGSKNQVAVFSVNRQSGPDIIMSTKAATKPGIISALALDGAGDNVLAVGTFSATVALFADEGQGGLIAAFACQNKGGVTKLVWSKCARYLFISSRRASCIEVWDVRGNPEFTGSFDNAAMDTNQRLGADYASDGKWLAAGGTDGYVRIWGADFLLRPDANEKCKFKAHDDSIGGLAFHPSFPLIASCDGSRGGEGRKSLKIWDFAKLI